MSAQLLSANEPGGKNASLQGTTVGGRKPLHRFMRGQPKIIGVRHTHTHTHTHTNILHLLYGCLVTVEGKCSRLKQQITVCDIQLNCSGSQHASVAQTKHMQR